MKECDVRMRDDQGNRRLSQSSFAPLGRIVEIDKKRLVLGQKVMDIYRKHTVAVVS